MVLVWRNRQTCRLIQSETFSFLYPTGSQSRNQVDFTGPMAPHLKAELVKLVMWLYSGREELQESALGYQQTLLRLYT